MKLLVSKIRLLKKRYLAAALVVSAAVFSYAKFISPTKIALLNYQDFQTARIVKANDSQWIEIERLNKTDIDTFSDYDIIYLFGRGLSLTQEQVSALKIAGEAGTKLVVEASTNPNIDVTNIAFKKREKIQDYLRFGGSFNYQQLLRFSRTDLDNKTFGIAPAEAAQENTMDVLFHLDEQQLFSEVKSYEDYYQTLPNFSANGKKVALITSVPGPFNANRDHLNSLIEKLEEKGLQVYPIASFTRRLAMIKEIAPDAVVMMPHGRMQLGNGQKTIDYLAEQNIPLLAPLSVFEHHEKWLDNPQGYSANLLTMNVVLPELDGAAVPYAINAQFLDENNYQIFKAMPKRLNNFADMLTGWLSLKTKANRDKKIAIVYFKGPGKNAMVAGNMEVSPSLYNTLQSLKQQGYDLGDLPDDYAAFKNDIARQGVVMAPYAQGLLAEFLAQGKPALIDAKTYQNWCYNKLADGLCQQIDQTYGQAPGNFMVTEHQGSEHIAVARIQYGNIALLPQPLPGIGKDTFKLIHGTKKAPPHSYVAPYMWIREHFNADAIMHFGTHGSLEFTQGKQVALSENDWADALIGNTPHYYVYTMANVGEGIIAKRRTYATLISHLTAPFKESGLYSDLKTLDDLANEFDFVQGSVQTGKKEQINQLIKDNSLLVDLSLTEQDLTLDTPAWREKVFKPLSQWLETIAQAKITSGLYTLGKAYNNQQAQSTAALMTIDALTTSYQEILALTPEHPLAGQDLHAIAKNWIALIFQGESSEQLLSELVEPQLLSRADTWFSHNKPVNQSDIIKGFIALGGKGKQQASTALPTNELKALAAQVFADTESKDFIAGLANDQSFAHVTKALDPEMAKKAKLLAKVIPAIGKAVTQLEKPAVRQLVIAMQNEPSREQVFSWLSSNDLANEVATQKAQHLVKLASSLKNQLAQVTSPMAPDANWLSLTEQLAKINDLQQTLSDEPDLLPLLSEAIANETQLTNDDFVAQLEQKIADLSRALAAARVEEQQIAEAVQLFKQALSNLTRYQEHLANGSTSEMAALINAFDGGYTKPSSGGDPIVNPSALPTGKNLFSIDAEKTPSVAAWQVGKQLAQTLLAQHLAEQGKYPEKVSFTLWPTEFIDTQGATIAEILYLLGVEPVRDPFGRVSNLKLIPSEVLQRPRIDVVIQSAGQLRDLAASRLALIEKAVRMVADAKEDGVENYVAKGVKDAEQYMLANGVSPLEAKNTAYRRSFGGVNGAYGTAIMSQVEQGASWEADSEIAQQYINNMGAVYGDSESWGEFNPHLFAAALQNTEVVIQPRSGNTWGALSLDHVYEFMGGLNLAVREVTGNDPTAYFNDYRNPNEAKLATLEDAISTELRTTLLNPGYIEDLMQGEATSAEKFAETFRNTYGWNVMKPDAIDNSVWDQLHQVYIQDSLKLNVQQFFEQQNPYALQELTGVMLETARKGLWQASEQQLAEIAQLHAELIANHQAGCGDFTCGNNKLQAFIKTQLADSTLAQQYQTQLDAAQIDPSLKSGMVLAKKDSQKPPKEAQEQATEQQPVNKPNSTHQDRTKNDNLAWLWLLLLMPVLVIVLRRKRHA